MTGVYFGYNMMSISSNFRTRIASLEDRVDHLEKSESPVMVALFPDPCVNEVIIILVSR